jgi:hypothetical protein
LNEIFEVAFDGDRGSKVDFLRDVANTGVGKDGSSVRFQLFSEDLCKGRLAHSVGSNDSHDMAGGKGKIQVYKKGMKRKVGLFEVIDRKLNLAVVHYGFREKIK